MIISKSFLKQRRRVPSFRPTVERIEARNLLSFNAPISQPFGVYATLLASGDFNGDGIPDLVGVGGVLGGGETSAVGIALGRGDGSFQPAQSYSAIGSLSDEPGSPILGDFNGDGHLDVAVATFRSNTVTVLLGNGDGSFQSVENYTVGPFPRVLAMGDFNGDGHLDLAVANGGSVTPGTVSLLLGNGDGTFQEASRYVTGNSADALAVGDFNGDGRTDLAVAGSVLPDYQGTVSILLNNGDGTFQPAHSYLASSRPISVIAGDFNRDGIADLVLVNASSVTVLLGKGDGSFGEAQLTGDLNLAFNAFPASVAVGDFNGDGAPDLITANDDWSVTVLLSQGDGTFQSATTYDLGSNPSSVAVGDFNGDGKLDFAALGGLGVIVVLGHGDGTFKVAPTYGGFGGAMAVAEGDFNGDGILDLAVAGVGDNAGASAGVNILLGNGDGTFQPPVHFASGAASAIVVGDFNGDGHLDLAVTDPRGGPDAKGAVEILLGNGDGTFQTAQVYPLGVTPASLAVGDFNGDGLSDLAVGCSPDALTPGWVRILLSNGDGSLRPTVDYATGEYPDALVVGDFNGDGSADLAVGTRFSHSVSILLGNGDSTFRAGQYIQFYDYTQFLAAADVNGDGIPDLIVANYSPSFGVTILLGIGNGWFQVGPSYTTGVGAVAVGDFNQDGHPDLAVVGGGGAITIALGKGDGTFQVIQTYLAGTTSGSAPFYAGSLVAGDFNGDGFPDLAAANSRFGVAVVLNAADWGGGHAARSLGSPKVRSHAQPARLAEVVTTLEETAPAPAFLPRAGSFSNPRVNPGKLEAWATAIQLRLRGESAIPALLGSVARRDQETLIELWGDPVVDLLAWNLLR